MGWGDGKQMIIRRNREGRGKEDCLLVGALSPVNYRGRAEGKENVENRACDDECHDHHKKLTQHCPWQVVHPGGGADTGDIFTQ